MNNELFGPVLQVEKNAQFISNFGVIESRIQEYRPNTAVIYTKNCVFQALK